MGVIHNGYYVAGDGIRVCSCPCFLHLPEGAGRNMYPLPDRPSVWLWYHRIGNVSPLCQACFDGFMKNAVKEPDLAPERYERVR